MSKFVILTLCFGLICFFGSAACAFYSDFPGCIAPQSFLNLAFFLGVLSGLSLFAMVMALAEGLCNPHGNRMF